MRLTDRHNIPVQTTAKAFPRIDDERILPLLTNMNKYSTSREYVSANAKSGSVTAADVPKVCYLRRA